MIKLLFLKFRKWLKHHRSYIKQLDMLNRKRAKFLNRFALFTYNIIMKNFNYKQDVENYIRLFNDLQDT